MRRDPAEVERLQPTNDLLLAIADATPAASTDLINPTPAFAIYEFSERTRSYDDPSNDAEEERRRSSRRSASAGETAAAQTMIPELNRIQK